MKKLLVIWKLRADPGVLILERLSSVISAPRGSFPAWRETALIRLNSVDLPAPLGPINACPFSPCAIESVMPRMISVLAEALATPVNSSAASSTNLPPRWVWEGPGWGTVSALMDYMNSPPNFAPDSHVPSPRLDLDRIPRALEATARGIRTRPHHRAPASDKVHVLDTVRIQGEPEHPDGGSAARSSVR